MKHKPLPPLAFVDIETTGSSPVGDRIIEIGILRVENNELIRSYQTLLNPQTHVPPFISDMTGINNHELQKAPTFREAMEEIYEILEGCVFVAHNARFDYGFLRNEFKRHRYTYTANVVCSVKLSRMLFPEHHHHNLDAIVDRFCIECENRHRAYDDAKVIWDFIQKIATEHSHLPLEETLRHLMKEPALPRYLHHEAIDELDEIPGVYIFYDESENPLYIGKSRSLRNRILSHFSGDSTSTTEMVISQQVRRIETIPTAGEIGALILEAQLIKEKRPMYNRRLRGMEKMTVVKQATDKKGYLTVKLVEQDSISVDELPDILHVAKSKTAAKGVLQTICKDHGLCKQVMGVEKGQGTCFDYKLGKCNGACDGKEKPQIYNAKFLAAFEPLRIPKWPYKGPVLVRERDRERNVTDIFLFDNWCCLAKLTEHDIHDIPETRYEYMFDLDTYKILKKFIKKGQVKVIPVPEKKNPGYNL